MSDPRDLIQRLADALERAQSDLYFNGGCTGTTDKKRRNLLGEARAYLLQPADLSHLSDDDFNALAPQGYHATGEATPEPAAGPTDDDLLHVFYQNCDSSDSSLGVDHWLHEQEFLAAARAVLSRYGNQPPQPIPLSDCLPTEAGPTDEELFALCMEVGGESRATDMTFPARYARAVLARYGHQPPQPIPLSERLPLPEANGQD